MTNKVLTALFLTAALACAGAAPALAAGDPVPAPAAASSGFDAEIKAAKTSMMADPTVALDHARSALKLAEGTADPDLRAIQTTTAHWLEGEALSRLGRPAEAKPIIDAALGVVVVKAPGTKLNGDLLMSRGGIAAAMGDVQLALGSYQQAYNIFVAVGIPRSQAIALQNIGGIYNDAGDYERVLSYYEQSAEVYGDDPALGISAHNNCGRAYKELARYPEALAEFQKALDLAKQMNAPMLIASIMTNVASAKFLSGDLDGAEAVAIEALIIAGQDASAAGEQPFLWGVRAQVAFARAQLAAAAEDISRTFEKIDLAATTMPYRDFHRAAYDIYKALGEPATALAHLEAFKRLDDQARALAASTNNALMAAQFDYANQQLRISTLKSGQLEKEQELRDSRAAYQLTFMVGILCAAALIAGLSLFAVFKIRRSHNETRAANVQLNGANQALAKAVRARTEFLAMTSHEIRTPLNGILGMTQVMLMDPELPPETRENVEIVQGAGNTMKALVDDILDVAKMESGKLILESRAFDLKAMLSEIASLARAQGEAKGLAVGLDLDSCPARMTGDEQRLRQLTFNLVSNAIKFTDRGRVELGASVADGGRTLRLEVRDTGIGIAPENLTRIFESFQQVDATISRRHGGTGLGLAICDNLARAMGGKIAVESELGKGSVFVVTVPLPGAMANAQKASASPHGRAVLVADENLLRLSLVSAQLRQSGVEIVTAETAGETELAMANRNFSDIIVSGDLIEAGTLKGMSWLRDLSSRQPSTRVVVLADDALRAPLLACGVSLVVPPNSPAFKLVALLDESSHVGASLAA